jgi:trans-aconitate 2-methyltransferase
MSTTPEKDFGPIAEDYAFFETQATEAQEDARAYLACLADIVPAEGTIRMLDFGCGSGTFTERFLRQAGWSPERLRLTLVEPVESARRQATKRLAGFSKSPIVDTTALSDGSTASFEIVLANHVLYYVPDVRGQLATLIDALSPTGIFMTAIAARRNALIEFWITGFGLLGEEVPYHTSEDVEATLNELGAQYEKQQVAYELTFPDSEENRMRIIRFLLAEHLAKIPHGPLFELFDQYADSGRINMQTASDHFRVRSEHEALSDDHAIRFLA